MDMVYLVYKIILNYILISYQYLKMEIFTKKIKIYRLYFEERIGMSDNTGVLLPQWQQPCGTRIDPRVTHRPNGSTLYREAHLVLEDALSLWHQLLITYCIYIKLLSFIVCLLFLIYTITYTINTVYRKINWGFVEVVHLRTQSEAEEARTWIHFLWLFWHFYRTLLTLVQDSLGNSSLEL